jgi:hypothetical protein
MVTMARRQENAAGWNMLRARQLVDTAMSPQRIVSGLSVAAPAPRAFARAAAYSLLLWSVILLALVSV